MADEHPLVEQPNVVEVIAEAHVSYPRFHDLYDGLTWRLCRDPVPDEAVTIAPETYVVRSARYEYEGFCQILLVYTFDGDQLVVEDLRVDTI